MDGRRFEVGMSVVVISLGRKMGVVRAVAPNGLYHVQIGALSMACRDADLAQVPAPAKREAAKPPASRHERDRGEHIAGASNPRVDLHGMTVEEAVSVVMHAIDVAIQDGADRLEIVHGKGTGRLKAAVQRELARLTVVRDTRPDPRNPGVTWAYF